MSDLGNLTKTNRYSRAGFIHLINTKPESFFMDHFNTADRSFLMNLAEFIVRPMSIRELKKLAIRVDGRKFDPQNYIWNDVFEAFGPAYGNAVVEFSKQLHNSNFERLMNEALKSYNWAILDAMRIIADKKK